MKLLLVSLAIAATLLKTATPLLAQLPVTLEMNSPGQLNITGSPGAVYAIQYATNLVGADNWICPAFMQMPAANTLWLDSTATVASKRFYRTANVQPTNMVFVPPGSFTMGSPTNELGRVANEGPQTLVTLTRGFWMSIFLVTQAEYQSVVGNNPSQYFGNLNRPVEHVSQFDATNYCALLTANHLAVGVIPMGTRYRLPTEAEWEYACRGGTTTRFYFGDDPSYTNVGNYAWYVANSGGTTHPVGTKLPNPWGLYDMGGNTWEYCQDWFDSYSGGTAINPQGATTGTLCVIRGGGQGAPGSVLRSAQRGWAFPATGYTNTLIGFRIVLAPSQ